MWYWKTETGLPENPTLLYLCFIKEIKTNTINEVETEIRTYNYREDRIKNHKNRKVVRNIKRVVEQGRINLIQ